MEFQFAGADGMVEIIDPFRIVMFCRVNSQVVLTGQDFLQYDKVCFIAQGWNIIGLFTLNAGIVVFPSENGPQADD